MTKIIQYNKPRSSIICRRLLFLLMYIILEIRFRWVTERRVFCFLLQGFCYRIGMYRYLWIHPSQTNSKKSKTGRDRGSEVRHGKSATNDKEQGRGLETELTEINFISEIGLFFPFTGCFSIRSNVESWPSMILRTKVKKKWTKEGVVLPGKLFLPALFVYRIRKGNFERKKAQRKKGSDKIGLGLGAFGALGLTFRI